MLSIDDDEDGEEAKKGRVEVITDVLYNLMGVKAKLCIRK